MDITFGSPKDDKNKPQQKAGSGKGGAPSVSNDHVLEEIGVLNRRLKIIENSLSNLRVSVQSLEKNFVDTSKDSKRDIKTLEEENNEFKDGLRSVKDTLKKIVDDMGDTARAEEVKVIQAYLDLWNPVKFVTAQQVKRIASDVFADMNSRARQNFIERGSPSVSGEAIGMSEEEFNRIQEQKQNL